MKPCKYCGESINDTARKCPLCQSYQDPADAPKQSFDLASIVISFVGVIATLGTLAAGVFGYFGFRTIGDINDRTKEINQRSNSLLETTEQKIKTFDGKVVELTKLISDLQQQAGNVRKDLNGVAVSELYDKFQRIFDVVQLDYAYNYQSHIQALTKIASESAAMQPVPEATTTYVKDMQALSQAVTQYRDALKENNKDEWLSIVNIVQNTSTENLEKYRLLVGCYSHLYEIARRSNNTNEARDYVEKQKRAAFLAFKSAERLNRAAVNVKVNYAMTLIQSGDPQEMKRGHDLLTEARKDAPQVAGIRYNLAVYFVKLNQYEEALKNLEQAKTLGDFATCDDVTQWDRDSDFNPLRLSDVPDYKDRISKLRQVGSDRC
jgi:tetratricopeptide (TPR) repeat protein